MLKRPQDGRPKFPIFFKNRPKMLAITVFGPRCLLEASKSLPRASREPPKSRSRALKRHPRAFKKLHAASQEPSQRRPRSEKAPKPFKGQGDTGASIKVLITMNAVEIVKVAMLLSVEVVVVQVVSSRVLLQLFLLLLLQLRANVHMPCATKITPSTRAPK